MWRGYRIGTRAATVVAYGSQRVNADVTQAGALLYGQETVDFGDAGVSGCAQTRRSAWPEVALCLMQPGKRRHGWILRGVCGLACWSEAPSS